MQFRSSCLNIPENKFTAGEEIGWYYKPTKRSSPLYSRVEESLNLLPYSLFHRAHDNQPALNGLYSLLYCNPSFHISLYMRKSKHFSHPPLSRLDSRPPNCDGMEIVVRESLSYLEVGSVALSKRCPHRRAYTVPTDIVSTGRHILVNRWCGHRCLVLFRFQVVIAPYSYITHFTSPNLWRSAKQMYCWDWRSFLDSCIGSQIP